MERAEACAAGESEGEDAVIKVGDKVRFRRNGEWCEGFATVAAVWPEIQSVDLDGMPDGIEPGDEMVLACGASDDVVSVEAVWDVDGF